MLYIETVMEILEISEADAEKVMENLELLQYELHDLTDRELARAIHHAYNLGAI